MSKETIIAVAGVFERKEEMIQSLCERYLNKNGIILEYSFVDGDSRIDTWSKYDSVLLVLSGDAEADDVQKELLVGHPHLRAVEYNDNYDCLFSSVCCEIDAILSGLEIEKKFLIEYPDFELLSKYKPFRVEISQTYLVSSVGSHRIRKRGANGEFSYFETLKIRMTESCCEESERLIAYSEYIELMKSADVTKSTINKFRYCFLYENQYLELDVFPFWKDRALLEIEVKNEYDIVSLPNDIRVIEDVTNNPRYKNNYLASLKL